MPGHDLHTDADREFHEATADLYDPLLLPIFGVYYETSILPILDELAAGAPGRRALDLGCGTGGVTVELARRGFAVHGIDHSAAMLALAADKVRAAGMADRVTLLTGDIRALPFDDAAFDAVGCQGVLHHLPDLGPAVEEIARVLAPGGLVYLAEPCVGTTPAYRAWIRALTLRARLRARRSRRSVAPSPTSTPSGREIPHHDEGPVDAHHLLALLERSALRPRVEYSSRFEGTERLPRRLQVLVIKGLSWPWRRRCGNLLFVVARKRQGGSGTASAAP